MEQVKATCSDRIALHQVDWEKESVRADDYILHLVYISKVNTHERASHRV